jgi:hypothetical protein
MVNGRVSAFGRLCPIAEGADIIKMYDAKVGFRSPAKAQLCCPKRAHCRPQGYSIAVTKFSLQDARIEPRRRQPSAQLEKCAPIGGDSPLNGRERPKLLERSVLRPLL